MNPITSSDIIGLNDSDQAIPVHMSTVAGGVQVEDEDAPLIVRCRQGDVVAFGLLVARHERRIVSIVSRILMESSDIGPDASAPVDVEDIAQEVFVQAWRALPRFRGESRLATWLYRIATNRALKEWNRRRRGNGRVQGTPVPEEILRNLAAAAPTVGRSLDPEQTIQARARDLALRQAIDSLPEKQRLVILLHYFEEYSCEEIAKVLECSVGTVWSRLHYACRRLREHLQTPEGPDSVHQPSVAKNGSTHARPGHGAKTGSLVR